MEWQQLINEGFGRVLRGLEMALKDLKPDDLNAQPTPDCNSIGWIAWHLARTQDSYFSSIIGEEQIYIKDGWYAKFHRAPDPKDTGNGHTLEQVAAFKSPEPETFLQYYRALLERTKRYLATLSAADLDRVVSGPPNQPPPTVATRIINVLNDNMQHAGAIAYVRGLLKGKGWARI